MSKPTRVPKFGNWDANDQMPFTLVFEKARADHKGGTGASNKVMNPNDPSENPVAFGFKSTGATPSSQRSSQQYYADELGQGVHVVPNVSGSPVRSAMVEHAKKGSYSGMRDSEGRLGNRPTIPLYVGPDKKGPSEGGTSPYHPVKTRLRPASRGEDMFPERSSALPKFGAWNEKDPSSGDGFTAIFGNARKEKIIGGPPRIPAHQCDSPVKADFDDAYKSPHQSFQQKVSRWLCCSRA